METLDGYAITTTEQTGYFRGEDIGRVWVQHDAGWHIYGGRYETERRRLRILAAAQTRTASDFDDWFENEG